MNIKIHKYLLTKIYRPWVLFYIRKDRNYRHDDLKLIIRKGVFHPGLFFSTGLLLQFLKTRKVKGRKLLELGAGSGLISLVMAQRGADVYASDISPIAVKNIQENAKKNAITLRTLQSDLFHSLKGIVFDTIVINPPYYPRNPANEAEYAWFCGSYFDYFKKLFSELKQHIHQDSEVFLILSEDCALSSIRTIAQSENFILQKVYQKKICGELNSIFRLLPT